MYNIEVLIKLLISLRGSTLTNIAAELSSRFNKAYSVSSLSKKLKRGTISYEEITTIADILDYDIKCIDRKSQKLVN
jgi:hypothetical protein